MAKEKGGAIMKYDVEMARLAAQMAEQESIVGSGNNLSFRNGQLSYKGNPIPGNKLDVIVLDALIMKKWFANDFDPNNPESPDCFAFSEDRKEDNLAPHVESTAAQNETCLGCPHNEWGTADRGKGKACRDVRRLALITADDADTVEGIQKAAMAFAEISVTNVKYWAGYAQQLASTLKKPPFGVVTRLSCAPDKETQVKVSFEMVSVITDKKLYKALFDKYEQAQKELHKPYPKNTSDGATKSKGKKSNTKKKPAAAPAKASKKTTAPAKAKTKAASQEPATPAAKGGIKKVKF